ncbi:MAG: SDR family oxidoreductase [Chloroflexi bacterium]|nr:SDR family oxidoreductase [Chloroflexota bacterium]
MKTNHTILVTGATGYIGGRLIRPLLKAGYRVRVVTRNLNHLQGRSWLSDVETMQGNVLDAAGLRSILDGIDIAFYLIHSMADTGAFVERDMLAAENFAKAAADARVRQIIYLGGLGQADDKLSQHLSSRQKVGEILRAHHSGVTEFRAAMVVGAGSLSFEIVRNLTERLPIMIAPKWLYTRSQPIAIADVLTYLLAAIDQPEAYGEIIEIGGADVVTYRDMILHYARARGLRRFVIPVPVLTPRLSSYWVHMVTPVSASIVRPLIQGLVNEMIVTADSAARLFPTIQPLDFETGLHAALSELDAHQVETAWTDSMSATWEQDEPYTFVEERGMLIERRVRQVNAPPAAIYQTFTSLGGETGWLYLNFLWHLRGWMDRIVGGPGYRRGRPQREALRIGDAVDFWRVEAIEPDHMLRLRAEMKLPGKGWLQFQVEQTQDGSSQLVQTAYFAPHGLFGYVYWYAIFFLHRLIFDGLVNRVVSAAEHGSRGQRSAAT